MISNVDKSGSNPPSPLPRSREALAVLLEDVRKIAEPLHVIQGHQRHRIKVIRDCLKAQVPPSPDQREQLAKMASVGMQHWADGVRPIHLVGPYLDGAKLGKIFERLRRAAELREQATTRWPLQPDAFADALEAEIRIVEEFLAMLFDLRRRIIDALDNDADTRADSSKKSLVRPPKNLQVLELYMRLRGLDSEDTSERAFAIDFCDGDRKKAETLLRQVRRYRSRLKRAET